MRSRAHWAAENLRDFFPADFFTILEVFVMDIEKNSPQGLSTQQARKLAQKYGKNVLAQKKKESLALKLVHTVCEPMFLLLLAASFVYFILG